MCVWGGGVCSLNFEFCLYRCLSSVYVFASHARVMLSEVRGVLGRLGVSCRQLWAAMWALEIEHWSSRKAAGALNRWPSLLPKIVVFKGPSCEKLLPLHIQRLILQAGKIVTLFSYSLLPEFPSSSQIPILWVQDAKPFSNEYSVVQDFSLF